MESTVQQQQPSIADQISREFSPLFLILWLYTNFKVHDTSSIEQYTCHKMFYDRNIMY